MQVSIYKIEVYINSLLLKISSAKNRNQISNYLTKIYNRLIRTPTPVLNVRSFRFRIREDLSYLNLQMLLFVSGPHSRVFSTLKLNISG